MKKRKVEDDKEINQVFMRVTRSKAANQDDGSVKTKSVLPSKAKKKISQKIEKNEIKEEVKEEIEEENEEDMEVEKKLEAEKKLEEEKTKGKKEEEEEESKKLDLDEKKESNKKLGEVTGGSSTAAAKSVNFLIESANTCSTYKGHQKRIIEIVKKNYPDAEILIPKTTRKNSFELTVNGKLIWSGLSKGPPRKLKFIESDEFSKLLKEAV